MEPAGNSVESCVFNTVLTTCSCPSFLACPAMYFRNAGPMSTAYTVPFAPTCSANNWVNRPDLQGVLDYTIRRYNHIGAWDVMVLPLSCPEPGCKVLGINCPWCPGVTLDPEVLSYPIHEGALILVHEALHDYWPYFGHAHVNPRIEKLEAMSWQVR